LKNTTPSEKRQGDCFYQTGEQLGRFVTVQGFSTASGRRSDQFDPKKKLPVAEYHTRFQVSGVKFQGWMFDVQSSINNHK
jgi:hypothetical protein